MAIELPSTNNANKYIQAMTFTFKASTGIFEGYDSLNKEKIETEFLEGVIVGQGFIFTGLIGKPVKGRKSTSYISEDFGFANINTRQIKIAQFTKNGTELKTEAIYGTKDELKEKGYKMQKTVFLLQGDNLLRIVFSGATFTEVSQFLNKNKDIPNFIVQISAKKDKNGEFIYKETDNGDFCTPDFKKIKSISPEMEETIVSNIKFIDAIVEKKEEIALPESNPASIPSQSSSKNGNVNEDLDEIPF